jgi:hypothetical protein
VTDHQLALQVIPQCPALPRVIAHSSKHSCPDDHRQGPST